MDGAAGLRGHAQVNRPRATWVSALIISIGPALLFNLMPLVLSSLAKQQSLGPGAVGFFAVAIMSGSMASTIVSAFWIRRVASWPHATALFSLCATLGYAALMAPWIRDSYYTTLALAFVVGIGNGSLHAAPTALISDTDSPSRGFALTIGLQVVCAGAVAVVAPGVNATWGWPGVVGVLAAFTAACIALSFGLPTQGLRGPAGIASAPDADAAKWAGNGEKSSGSKAAAGGEGSNVPVLLCLVGFMVFYICVTAAYSFTALQGQSWCVSEP